MVSYPYQRPIVADILKGLGMQKKLLHIMTGPRQVGKTTAALQIGEIWHGQVILGSADLPLPPDHEWIRSQWERARYAFEKKMRGDGDVLLILDEVQKIAGWSEVVKDLWDRTCRENLGIQVIILGSSSLLIQKGLSESLAGRFLLYRCTHWGLDEMDKAFSWDLDRWLFFGGYPGAAPLIEDENTWSRYVVDSLIETVIAKDVLQLQTIAKPALLRHLFMLSAVHPAQILSYNKMLGQLQDAGNTTTLSHYLKLLEAAYLISGLELFKCGRSQKRGSSPKLIIWNNGLINAIIGDAFIESRNDYAWWGRLLENAVGAHLLNHLGEFPYSVYYWRHRGFEMDFVVQTPRRIWGLEVKSGKSKHPKGMFEFKKYCPEADVRIIGPQGISFEEFFRTHPGDLF